MAVLTPVRGMSSDRILIVFRFLIGYGEQRRFVLYISGEVTFTSSDKVDMNVVEPTRFFTSFPINVPELKVDVREVTLNYKH